MPGGTKQKVHLLVEHLFRREAGRLLARLCRLVGLEHLDLAEEVVQDALVQALRCWPFQGIPEDPTGWLLRVARNRAIDLLRRTARFRRKLAEIGAGLQTQTGSELAWDEGLKDDQLAMMFACCHPALAEEVRVALTLKAVGGFSVAEVARAFLLPESTVAQRLVRAKRFLRESKLELTLPAPDELSGRLNSVLRVLYLLFNEGYAAHQGEDLVRQDLCGEAIRLSQILAGRPEIARPKVHALLALFLFQASRLSARVGDSGNLLLLSEQDRSLWDQQAIHLGMYHLNLAAEGDELTEYHLQAALAAVHAAAPSWEKTDWPRVLALYDQLAAHVPSPVVLLNRAVALSMLRGPAAGLAALSALRELPSLQDYYLLPAVEADLLFRLDRPQDAARCYHQALAASCTHPERRFLQQRLDACRQG